MDPMLASIQIFAGNFAPRGWAFCDGQLLPINQNSALFSLLGTTYGGDGRTTFGLPDLRGRAAIGPRHGPGLSDYRLGQRGGVEYVVLNQTQIPSHTHIATAATASIHTATAPTTTSPDGAYPSMDGAAPSYGGTKGTGKMATDVISIDSLTIGNTGGNLSHTNIQPYLAINYIIALVGIFPSRN